MTGFTPRVAARCSAVSPDLVVALRSAPSSIADGRGFHRRFRFERSGDRHLHLGLETLAAIALADAAHQRRHQRRRAVRHGASRIGAGVAKQAHDLGLRELGGQPVRGRANPGGAQRVVDAVLADGRPRLERRVRRLPPSPAARGRAPRRREARRHEGACSRRPRHSDRRRDPGAAAPARHARCARPPPARSRPTHRCRSRRRPPQSSSSADSRSPCCAANSSGVKPPRFSFAMMPSDCAGGAVM